jgi:hypothetical protein
LAIAEDLRVIMCHRYLVAWSVLLGMLIGCQNGESRSVNPPAVEASAPTGPAYLLSGGVAKPGRRPLTGTETVSGVLRDNMPAMTAPVTPPTASPGHVTVVFIRRGPEGKVRRLIDVYPNGSLVDPTKDSALRDGDELILPMPGVAMPDGAPTDRSARAPAN